MVNILQVPLKLCIYLFFYLLVNKEKSEMLIGIMFCIIERERERTHRNKERKGKNTADPKYTDFGALCPNSRNYKIMKIFILLIPNTSNAKKNSQGPKNLKMFFDNKQKKISAVGCKRFFFNQSCFCTGCPKRAVSGSKQKN